MAFPTTALLPFLQPIRRAAQLTFFFLPKVLSDIQHGKSKQQSAFGEKQQQVSGQKNTAYLSPRSIAAPPLPSHMHQLRHHLTQHIFPCKL